MKIANAYKKRPVRFLEIVEQDDWKVKLYSISSKKERVDPATVDLAKHHLGEWLKSSTIYPMDTYKIATLILHEGKEGCFAIISWWIDENMLQLFVYLASAKRPHSFELYSGNGIITCVWEMAVLWFERNAWVKHILEKQDAPDAVAYLQEQLNGDL